MTARCAVRRDEPILLVEMICVAAWIAEGDMIFDIARRLRRPVRQVRALVFGNDA